MKLHRVRTGNGKPPLVVLHGLTSSGACWAPAARAWEDEHDVIRPDARGHGESDGPERGYRYEDLAGDVVSLIDELRLTRPVLLGHSMGGLTAAVVAGLHPKLLGGLVLVDPTFLTPQRQREVYESSVAEEHRQLLSRPRDEVLAELRARNPHRSLEQRELNARARLQTHPNAFEVLTPPNPDYERLVRALEIPCLLVIGDPPGGVVSREVADALQRLNPRLHIEQIHGAGHGLPFDQPERFAAVVKAFLRETT